MKTKNPKSNYARLLASVMLLLLLAFKSYSQTYLCSIRNISMVDSKTLHFDVWISNTGDSTLLLQALQAGINFNYSALVNGGTITGSFVTGSADASLPVAEQTPNWRVNATSHQIQLLAAIARPASAAATIPSSSGIRIGTFELKNTNDFSSGVTPSFTWSFANGSSTATKTILTCYVNSSVQGTNITNQASHTIVP